MNKENNIKNYRNLGFKDSLVSYRHDLRFTSKMNDFTDFNLVENLFLKNTGQARFDIKIEEFYSKNENFKNLIKCLSEIKIEDLSFVFYTNSKFSLESMELLSQLILNQKSLKFLNLDFSHANSLTDDMLMNLGEKLSSLVIDKLCFKISGALRVDSKSVEAFLESMAVMVVQSFDFKFTGVRRIMSNSKLIAALKKLLLTNKNIERAFFYLKGNEIYYWPLIRDLTLALSKKDKFQLDIDY